MSTLSSAAQFDGAGEVANQGPLVGITSDIIALGSFSLRRPTDARISRSQHSGATGGTPMNRFCRSFIRNLLLGMMVVGCLVANRDAARAADEPRTNIHVVVTDWETGKPIYQARLTLLFQEESSTMKIKHSKPISFSAKTDLQGRYRFTDIPKGTVRLMVTAERHESYGKDIKIDKDNQEIMVRMKKPQPQI